RGTVRRVLLSSLIILDLAIALGTARAWAVESAGPPDAPASESTRDRDRDRDPDPAASAFFEAEVRPILVGRCQTCHGPDKAKAGLRLDSRAAILAGGESGPAIVAGEPGGSLLIDAINYGDLHQMPPKSKLPDREIAALTRWVAMGA